MRVVVFAISHYDNILAYTNAISKYTDLEITVILFAHGDWFKTSTFETNISAFKYGLTTENVRNVLLPPELKDYFAPRLTIWLLKLAPLKVTINNMAVSMFQLFKLARWIRNRFDVFHFNGTGLYSLSLSYFLRSRKTVLTIHDYIPHTGEESSFIERINPYLIRRFSRFIQHYEYLAEAMADHFQIERGKVVTIRSGTFDHFRQFADPQPEPGNYALFFGRISPYKGLRHLVEAFNLYCQRYDDLDLVIAGAGDISDTEELIKANPRIKLVHKRVPIKELVSLIQGCRFVICPYTDATHSAVTVVSYTFRKPVIAHDVGGLHEVIIDGKTGILMKDLTAETIMDSISIISHNKPLEDQMQDNIANICDTGILNWKSIAARYKRIYTSVMDQYD